METLILPPMDKKRCPKCEDTKSLEKFYKDSSKKDGYASHCKVCRKERERNNKEYVAKKARRYYQKNKEAHIKKVTEWQKNNKEAVAKIKRAYYQKNKKLKG